MRMESGVAGGTDLDQRLRELHDHYVFQVNVAVEEGRERDIDALVAGYPDEAARMIAEDQAGTG
jgi:hypothetical protein